MKRRDFLKTAGLTAIGAGLGACAPLTRQPEPTQWAMLIDLQVASDPGLIQACASVCHREHNVPRFESEDEEILWIRETTFEGAFPERVHHGTRPSRANLPVLALCNHCTDPPCVRVCPTQATWKRPDGIVMMDMHRCIGCRYCMAACPYGARSFNWRDPRTATEDRQGLLYFPNGYANAFPTRTIGVVEKCNFCAERLREGDEPACVIEARRYVGASRPEDGPLYFGNLAEDSIAVRKLSERESIVRKASAGTGPNVFYLV